MNMKFYLTGQKFGKLTVIREDGRTPDKERLWLCQCDCGNTNSVRSYALRNGRTKSCGCQINIKFQGETRTLKEWAEHRGLSYTTVYMRYRKGDRGARLFRSVKNAF